MREPMLARLAALLVAGGLLAGCESVPKVAGVVGMQSTPKTLELPPKPQARSWADAQEEVLNSRATGYGLVYLPEMEKYLTGLLQKIRTEAGVPDWPGKVYITASSSLDAYTQHSGNIYVSLTFLEQIQNEDELVGLLAHEFAHSYLAYAELQSTVMQTDKASDIASTISYVARAVDQGAKTAAQQETAMRPARNLLMAYQLGRNLLVPAWERSQEYAADDMAVQLSIRMGYSVPDGLVSMLERVDTQQQTLAKRKAEQRARMRQQFAASRPAQAGGANGKASKGVVDDVVTGLQQELVGQLSFIGKDLSDFLRDTHPDTDKRIDRANQLHEKLMADREWPAARNAEWNKLKNQRAVQRIFAGYRNAALAQVALEGDALADARRFARQSISAETQGHALPAMVLWQAGSTGKDQDVRVALQNNMRSAQHRAWRPYMLYAQNMQQQGNTREAKRVLDEGFAHFERAPVAWHEYIGMQMQFKDTDKAQKLAAECQKRFPAYGPGCRRAAMPPQPAGKNDLGWLTGWFER